jgi:virginiamycin B lyase
VVIARAFRRDVLRGSFRIMRARLLLLAALGALVAAPAHAGALSDAQLADALRRGGLVLYFRHAATSWTQVDREPLDLSRCSAQRNLSAQGRADAGAIGTAVRRLAMPVGAVLSSPFCRARDTARLAFGRLRVEPGLTGIGSASEAVRTQRRAVLRRLLATPPAAGRNSVLVAHLFNIQEAANVSLEEGEAVVFRPRGGTFRLLAKIPVARWGRLAATRHTSAMAPRVTLREYPVPAGSHPHDVAPARDGGVWYTAQASGALGWLDARTGRTRHTPLGDGSAPHGVIVGPDGAPWITDGGLNAIVRVDPRTRAVKKYPLPASAAGANLNTAVFDRAGRLWFTGQSGFYGRLDPRSGRLRVWRAPGGFGPYGITVTPNGDVYYASLAGSHIARIDVRTGRATRIEPPTSGQGARRVWSDSGGRIWVSEWNAGRLAMYDPAERHWREWKLPGPAPQPYAVYVDERDIVWVTDFGANALVRFDPRAERFTVFRHPTFGASVRQLLGRGGEVWGAESGLDRLVVARTR